MADFYEAWKQFQDGEHKGAFDATSLGAELRMNQYLGNRLWAAFKAGWNAGQNTKLEECKAKLARILDAP